MYRSNQLLLLAIGDAMNDIIAQVDRGVRARPPLAHVERIDFALFADPLNFRQSRWGMFLRK